MWRLCESEMIVDRLTVLLFFDVHIDIIATLNCLRVICGCRAIQTDSAVTSLALLAT